MDWRYILSLSPDDLNEEEKDELFNKIVWFDTDSEEVNLQKYQALFKISQELLKYKGEQIETVLHELDEIATRQGEEEARKIDSDTDGRSSKSHISSSIVLENLEQKYLELKSKYKKQVKQNENSNAELEKFKKQIVKLTQEKKQMQHELQVANQDGSQSDTTESFKEQHRELVETVHNKNKQISELLRDIEDVEKENFVLREKVTDLRDSLANATKELASLTENIKSTKIELEEKDEAIQTLTKEIESLSLEVKDACDQKHQIEEQLEEFTQEVNSRIDDWKKLLDEKDEEIETLKSKQIIKSAVSSPSRKSVENQKTHVSALNKVLNQREQQLLDVQIQLQDATKEMTETTTLLEKLKEERMQDKKKIQEYASSIKDYRKQLKASHARCQQLQEQTVYHEKIIQDKKDDLANIIQKLKDDGHLEASEYLNEVQELKALNRMREKQITNLVKTTNKLQETVDQFEKENEILRDSFGLKDMQISTHGYITKQQQEKDTQEKKIRSIKNKLNEMNEEKIQLKTEIHKQNKTISTLCNQILNLGGKPATSGTQESNFPYIVFDNLTKEEIKTLSEENEALRKGMHEILESLNSKRESSLKEIKSETFESLLRALDVKHVAGWYHPAMRLQAELHNIQGNNEELREQLRLTKLELESYKNKDMLSEVDTVDKMQEPKSPVIIDFNEFKLASFEEAANTLELLMSELEKQYKHSDFEKKYKNRFNVLIAELLTLSSENNKVKENLMKASDCLNNDINKLQQDNEILGAKLTTLVENKTEDSQKEKLLNEVANGIILNRKIIYLESENRRLSSVILNINNDILSIKTENLRKIKDLTASNKTLKNQLDILQGNFALSVDIDKHAELEKDLNNMTMKYRDLLKEFKNVSDSKEFEINVLKESENQLKIHKTELLKKIENLLTKLYKHQNNEDAIDERIESLSKKLAECEVNEISEKQRANHTNNLYELVKEQLQKSEERFKEFEKYNKEILRKNLVLQEHLIELENKLTHYVDHNTFSKVQKECNNILEKNSYLENEISKLEKNYSVLEETSKSQKLWTDSQEQQLLHLRHQIVDLQSVSDEKTVIAQLSSDVIQARLNESASKSKLDNLLKEFNDCKQQCDELIINAEKIELDSVEMNSNLKERVRILEDILSKRKTQYFGCVPLVGEEEFTWNLKQVYKDKHEIFKSLHEAQKFENEAMILKEQYEIDLRKLLGEQDETKPLPKWQNEKITLLKNEIHYKRKCDFKDMQLNHALQRIQMQDSQIIKLEEELLQLHSSFDLSFTEIKLPDSPVEKSKLPSPKPETTKTFVYKMYNTQETQTNELNDDSPQNVENNISSLRAELFNKTNEIAAREQFIQTLKSKVTELEMNISLFRKQIGDKQSQISFYEKHILELQTKKEDKPSIQSEVDSSVFPLQRNNSNNSNENEMTLLKSNIKSLQETVMSKEQAILQLQSLLKQNRDNHSLAAARMQNEVMYLKKALNDEKQKYLELQKSQLEQQPNKAAIEQYILQVHSLEKHSSEMHTKITCLESQLQASREEAVRWRSLANDRLTSIDQVRKDLEDRHREELLIYKKDSEKWREEVTNLKQMINKHRADVGDIGSDVQRLLKEKDDKIHELTAIIRKTKSEVNKQRQADKIDDDTYTEVSELEVAKETLLKEHETLKRRFESLLNREKNAREEVRELKGQLLKKPVSARTDKSERSIKDQMQKKINNLENEIEQLQTNLKMQISINESHKIKINEDFDKWKKQKQWQQSAEKLKTKLKEKEADNEKLQQTCNGFRLLISRLEREKHNLENRIKHLKSIPAIPGSELIESLKLENLKLLADIDMLNSKLEIQHHHAGGLGAAMLQEKLEAQERKIAVLELTAKGSAEVRGEMERLHNNIISLQKNNIALEAEKLELKLDLEKSSKEVPYLRDQNTHLENYVEVLKSELDKQQLEKSPTPCTKSNQEAKKVSDLERTVFILKRIVEKLQVENKRLLSGKRPFSGSNEKLNRDFLRLKEQYCESIQKVSQLEQNLSAANSKLKFFEESSICDNSNAELATVKSQLEQKSQLLNKVKILLHRASIKEKALLDEIAVLRIQA